MYKNLLITLFSLLSFSLFAQKNYIDQPYVEIAVKVDTLVVPDKIHITININEIDNRNKVSVEEQERLLSTTLKSLNIDIDKNLSILDYSSNFKTYFIKGQQIAKSKMYSLTVNNATTAGNVFTELEKVGISNISISKTEYENADALLMELRHKAIEKSKLIAIELAKPLNQKIGKALHISDGATISNALNSAIPSMKIAKISNNGADNTELINIEFQKVRFEAKIYIKYVLD